MKLTKRNRAYLRKHAKFLYALTDELNRCFTMGYYARDCEDRWLEPCNVRECGTIMCALGYAAIVFPHIAKKHDTWWRFCTDVFGFGELRSEEWDFLFSMNWTDRDNTTSGAADRITYFLKHGVPDDCWNPEVYQTS